MAELDPVFGSDTDEEIMLCLQCGFEDCRNCLAYKGRVEDPYSSAQKRKPYPQKIDQYSLEGEFIRTWNRRGDIERELGITGQYVSHCCIGKRGQVGGYIWRYHKEDNNV